jgi:mannose-6-phosphate isomerase-like protein (cupin superfamily)
MKFSSQTLLNQLPTETGSPFVEIFRKGNISAEMYKPEKVDLQTPHTRDEFYFIVSGSGMFQNGEEHYPFKASDLIFVPAFVEHRFYDFTDDFSTWVVFF